MSCAICGSEWHETKDCPKRPGLNEPKKDPDRPDPMAQIEAMGICPHCGTSGHTAKKCPRAH